MAKGKDRHTELGLKEEDLIEMYRYMLTARFCDERQWGLNRMGKAPFVVPVSGHEAAQVGSAWAFERGKDVFCPYYRDLALVLVAGFTPKDVFLGLFGKADDPSSGGRQMPAHWGSSRHNIVTGSSPIATQVLHAAGVALAKKLKKEDAVVGTWFGEGGTSEGDWHGAMNMAGIHKLPLVFVCENNQYAISVHESKQVAGRVFERAKGYGMPGYEGDGNDVLESYRLTKDAVDRARAGEGPTLLELRTYRFYSHTSDDDDRTYRTKEEVEEAKRRDPIPAFETYLKTVDVLDDDKIAQMREETKTLVSEGAKEAEEADWPDPSTATRHVYADLEVE
ncbi:MAG TPA: thiamine pyrophosphate-dependent dehydrogenase E1 component subunit alpha [Actinomycetota bacterium]|jgi:2-oxoisovalerate dehydrogenase E1 component alpha subunit|nr:thiamine pyrophosphate-dependent dehydrogenase E1 component subunit alpha [Actinomycetota bacterium]